MTKLAPSPLRCALLASGILALLPLACSANQDSDLFNASGGSGGEGGQGGSGGTGSRVAPAAPG